MTVFVVYEVDLENNTCKKKCMCISEEIAKTQAEEYNWGNDYKYIIDEEWVIE